MNAVPNQGLQFGLVAIFSVFALALLATFYSVVSGAVDHAEARRAAAAMGLVSVKAVARTAPSRSPHSALVAVGVTD